MILGSKSKIFPLVKLVAESFLTMSTLDQDQLFHTLRITPKSRFNEWALSDHFCSLNREIH